MDPYNATAIEQASTDILTSYGTTMSKFVWRTFLAALIEAVWTGGLMFQVVMYYQTFSKDRMFYRIVVAFLVFLSIGQMIVVAYEILTIADNLDSYILIVTSDGIIAWLLYTCTGCATFTGQLFIAERIWRLRGKVHWAMCVLAASMILGSATVNIVSTVQGITLSLLGGNIPADELETRNIVLGNIVTAWSSLTLATDLMLSGFMMFTLLQKRKQSGFLRSKKMLKQILIITSEALFFPSLVQLGYCITMQTQGYYAAGPTVLQNVMTPLVANMVLYTLLSRDGLRRAAELATPVQFLSGFPFSPGMNLNTAAQATAYDPAATGSRQRQPSASADSTLVAEEKECLKVEPEFEEVELKGLGFV